MYKDEQMTEEYKDGELVNEGSELYVNIHFYQVAELQMFVQRCSAQPTAVPTDIEWIFFENG